MTYNSGAPIEQAYSQVSILTNYFRLLNSEDKQDLLTRIKPDSILMLYTWVYDYSVPVVNLTESVRNQLIDYFKQLKTRFVRQNINYIKVIKMSPKKVFVEYRATNNNGNYNRLLNEYISISDAHKYYQVMRRQLATYARGKDVDNVERMINVINLHFKHYNNEKVKVLGG